jgi:hypothetical protein
MTDPARPYGEGRLRSNVSYADVERAAIAILKSGRRPTVETIREALGGGSPDTIGDALRRFWRDLGARIEGDPAALTRMPAEIAALADGMWQRALKLSSEAATHNDNAARERLRQLEVENEIKQRSFELREREIDAQARERERALADARDHLLSLSKAPVAGTGDQPGPGATHRRSRHGSRAVSAADRLVDRRRHRGEAAGATAARARSHPEVRSTQIIEQEITPAGGEAR